MRTKRDKIFDNKFDEVEYDSKPMAFKVEASYSSEDDIDDNIHNSILFEKIDELITNSKYSEYAKYESGNEDRIGKAAINEIYLYVSQHVKEYTKTELFSMLCDYLDVAPNKFYNSLNNIAKEELILELDKKLKILDKKGIRKLF
jgi:hypothetical protein